MDEAHLRGRYQPRADGEQRKAEPDLTDAERRQPTDVISADLTGTGEGKKGRDKDRLRDAGGGRHRDVVAPACDHDHQREGERGDEREAVAREAALTRGAQHQRDAGQRQDHLPRPCAA